MRIANARQQRRGASAGQSSDNNPFYCCNGRQCLNGVIEFCILRGIRDDDQVLRLQRALPRYRGGHIPIVTKIQGVGPLMRTILGYEGRVVRGGLHGLPARPIDQPARVGCAETGHQRLPGKPGDYATK